MSESAILTLDDPRWRALVDRSAESTAFHRPGWLRALATAYSFDPFVVARFEGDEIVAGAPVIAVGRRRAQRWVSLPFTDACPPIGEHADVQALVAGLEQMRLARRIDSVELRGAVDGSSAPSVVAGVIHELELASNPSRVRTRLHPSQVRRNIDRAHREGVEVAFETGREALVDTFYRLHLLTRRRKGVPIQPRRFFAHLWEEVIADGGGFVVVARVRGRPAAAAVFLDGAGTLTFKFGASDPELLRARPNHAVLWAAIEWACGAGRHTFDMGRTDLDNEGLRAFKSGWGASERPLVYTYVGKLRPATRIRAGLLRPLIRHSPSVVCRGIGEALYRRAACGSGLIAAGDLALRAIQ